MRAARSTDQWRCSADVEDGPRPVGDGEPIAGGDQGGQVRLRAAAGRGCRPPSAG